MNLKRNTGSPEEIKLALEIYNSNSDFLMHHIGKSSVDEGANIIRVDVVNDHEPNVIPFWEKMGFVGQREERLTWGDKESTVLVMEKRFSY